MKKPLFNTMAALVLTLSTFLNSGTAHAVLAGQNGKLLYGEWPTGATQLISQDPNGANRTNITPPNPARTLRSATWSPDGSYIYYIKEGTTYGSAIYAAKPDKSFEMRISGYSSSNDYDDIALSPDGTRIFYSNGTCVGVLDIKTSGSGCMINSIGASYIHGIATSPDGQLIAFGTQYGVYTYNPSVIGSTNQITTNQNGARVLDWSADGTKIAYTTPQDGGQPLFFTDSGTTNTLDSVSFDTDPSHASDIYYDAVFSPDSTSIAYNKDGVVYVSTGFTATTPTVSVQSTGATAGIDWQAIGNGSNTSLPSRPFTRSVHRFYSPLIQRHLYTADENEVSYIKANFPSSVWSYEGTSFNVNESSTCTPGESSVYRFYSTILKSHLYTIDENEKNYISSHFPPDLWKYEGVSYCANRTQVAGTTPVYRFYSQHLKVHLYTVNENEKLNIERTFPEAIWKYEGIAYYTD